MDVPLTRAAQIELMEGARERHHELISKWMNDPVIRAIVRSKEGPGFDMHEERLQACC